MKILVIGGAGYIGSIVMQDLQHRGYPVWAVDNLSAGHRPAVDPERLLEGDYGNPEFADWVCAKVMPELVVQCASRCQVEESAQKPKEYFENNVTRLSIFLQCLRRHQVKRLVFMSSAAVYGIPSRIPVDEDCPPAPINVYGDTKLAGERLVQHAAKEWGCGVIVFRLFNVCGATEDGKLGEHHSPETHAVPNAVGAALGLRTSFYLSGAGHLTPDGTTVRDYVSVLDVGEAVARGIGLLKAGNFGVYNIGSGVGTSIRQVITEVEAASRKPVPVSETPARPGDPPQLVADLTKTQRDFGWHPARTLRESIASTIRWFESHPGGFPI
ncbi:MAG: UDP-glucose 4-epimerase GalE [bacterium]